MERAVLSEKDTVQYITFWIDEELFGVHMALVQEVIPWGDITRVYKSAPYILGVINLRGQIVTILDVPTKLFGKGKASKDIDYGKIIILNLKNEQVGIAVKDVGEVLEAEPEELGEIPSNIPEAVRPYFLGMLRRGERTVAILDLERMFDG